jgi:uncharacterized protein YoxC|tara:strand:+ start:31 stop:363 length:333 start_codon:yes stop_codon:yes gene_type:complete
LGEEQVMEFVKVYAEYGALGVIVILFVYMIMNLIKSQKVQSYDLDNIRRDIARSEKDIKNIETIVIKFLDRWNRSDETRDRRHEDMVKELNDLSDVMMEVKGSVSRINGK